LCRHIEEIDLLRFFNKEEAALVLPMFEGASETGKIKKSALKTWVVMKISNAATVFVYNIFQKLDGAFILGYVCSFIVLCFAFSYT
jgi:hypothetical protein